MQVGTLIEQFHFDAMKPNSYIYDVIKQNYAVKLSRPAFRTISSPTSPIRSGSLGLLKTNSIVCSISISFSKADILAYFVA